ncbi:MAG: DUF1576 domain-containing protein [Erysipelotrichaceae bacterium]|nr:DUF1576 domain-containing protein [Erysipelotrichaceae bacterium]
MKINFSLKKVFKYSPDDYQKTIRIWIFLLAFLLLMTGLLIGFNPLKSIREYNRLLFMDCSLITDYFAVAGYSAAFINAGINVLLVLVIGIIAKVRYNGLSIGATYMVLGYGFFGKNALNILPVILGVYLYSVVKKEAFRSNYNIALLATACGPIVQYLLNHDLFNNQALGLIAGIILATAIGFVIAEVARFAAKIHGGMLLYNAGFALGIILMPVTMVMRSIGFEFASALTWSTDHRLVMGIYLLIIFALHILAGYLLNDGSFKGIDMFLRLKDEENDYLELTELPVVMINMGICGIMAVMYVFIILGDFAGPVLAAIFSIAGFGACGKNYLSICFPIIGIVILSFVSNWNLTDPGVLLATLFSTCIAPITIRAGWIWGIIGGMIHVSIAINIAFASGWLNLYNNGFTGGLVCLIVIPLLNLFRRRQL